MQQASNPVGYQTPLQEHVNAMKTVLEGAAEGLSEFEWLSFAAITSQALKAQRAPR